MVFRSDVASNAIGGYRVIADYFADVRKFYEVLATRLAAGEYGIRLVSVTGDGHLFSSTDSYRLPEATACINPAEPESCPSYIWFPTWLGAFYTSHSAPASLCGPMAFVWTWIGLDDAFVAPVPTPECWIGVVTLDDDGSSEADEVALQTWRFFRVELTFETEVDQWLTGGFHKNDIGCNLSGRWQLQRISLDKLSSFYEVEKSVVRPLSQRFLREREPQGLQPV